MVYYIKNFLFQKRYFMKRIVAFITLFALVFACCVFADAAVCSHSYKKTDVAANCTEKAYTHYACTLCGHTYKEYKDAVTLPDSFYILAESTRSGNTLTVTVKIGNNPGIYSAKLTTAYNGEALSLREAKNGTVWTQNDFTGGWNTGKNPFNTFVEDVSTGTEVNRKNGVFYTLVFDVIDDSLDYGIKLSHTAGSFPVWDDSTNSLVKHTPKLINIIGASELGDHTYESATVPPTCTDDGYTLNKCTYCGDSSKTDVTKAKGHSWEVKELIQEPTFTEEGSAKYVCSVCSAEETRAVPVLERYKKCDINNDGDISAKDANVLLRFLVGDHPTLQEFDAADCVEDDVLNGKDSNKMKRVIAGTDTAQ